MSARPFRTSIGILMPALFLLVFVSVAIAQAPQPTAAPLNPAFVNFFQRHALEATPNTTESGYPLGFIPPPVDLSMVRAPKSLLGRQLLSLPITYDLRPLAKLTGVRDQANCGSCWAFAAFGSLESCLMPGESTDFSENGLKNNAGFDIACCDGGNEYMSTAYLARWDGPVYEWEDPYNTGTCTSTPGGIVRKHVQNVDFIPNKTGPLDNDLIKQAVMTCGAVYTSFYWGNSYYNSSQYAYYFYGSASANHAVCIVGWDDNFDKSKFLTPPPGNGAFIVRNSWGPYWGQSGYFYMSYYDVLFGKENSVVRVVEPVTNYSRIYQYDPLGWVDSYGYNSNTAWFANVFTSTATEVLSAVSFYAAAPDSSYQVRIYLDPTNGPLNSSDPVYTATGTVPMGYQTIPIYSEPYLNPGQKFSVVISLNTPGYIYPVPVEARYSGWSSGATANPGESYMSQFGASWVDLTSVSANMNCCIKAFTKDRSGLVVTPTPGLTSIGPVGGPFIPSSQVYTLTNSSAVPINWTAAKTQSWVGLSSTGGTLSAHQSTTVTVSISSVAGTLGTGVYSDTVSFANTTNGLGDTTRAVSLTVKDAFLDVGPADGLTSFGEPGGAFSTTSKVYTVKNTGCTTLTWAAARSQSWLDLSATGGTLAPNASTNVTVSLDSAAEDLPLGDYSDAISFTNVTNGAGSTSRPVGLTVAHNYYIEPATFSWVDPGGRVMNVREDGVMSFPMPFTFYYYGQPCTTLYVGANGLLGFNDALTATENTDLPTSAIPNGAIYPYWDDLDPSGGGYVRTYAIGTAPNRQVVVTWQGVPHNGSTNPLSFQALLCEGSNDIIFQYQEVQPGDASFGAGRSATVGIENSQGTVAKVYSFNGSTLLTNSLAIRFTMDPGDISVMKKLPNNAAFSIHRAIISCACTSQFYIESDDRSCGIMVSKSNHGFPAGIRVDIKGTLATMASGEKYIKNPIITPNGKGSVKPWLMTNRALGGEDFSYDSGSGAGQRGVKDALGLNNIGLLVRVTGRVTFVGDTYFYVDDGSKLNDGSGYIGVRVLGTEVTMPQQGKYVRLIGASSCWKNGSDYQRQVRPPAQVIEQY